VLSEEEKGFNQTVLYGRDVTIEDIISTAKRYPMMAERQVVIVKEAQDLSRTIDKLESYADNQWLYRFSDLLQVQNIR
jgi:DNA polymerase-3 subunit delta